MTFLAMNAKNSIVPNDREDNLFAGYEETREANFLFGSESAVKKQNHLKASKLWQKHLGINFLM